MASEAQAKPVVTETVPKTWPGAFGVYPHSKLAVMTNLGTLIWLIVLSGVASLLPNLFASKNGEWNPLYAAMQVLSIVLSILLTGAMTYLMIQNIKKKKVDVNEALSAGVAKFVPLFVQCVVLAVLLMISLLLFVIPFFFVLPRVFLAPYYLFDRDLSPIDAIKASWEETAGHASKVWGIIGVNILIALLVATIIGIPLAIYFGVLYNAAEAVLYFWRKNHGHVATTGPTAPAGPILKKK